MRRIGAVLSALVTGLGVVAELPFAPALQAQSPGSVTVNVFAGAPDISLGAEALVGVAEGVAVVASVQTWKQVSGCGLRTLVCSRGGASFGVGARFSWPDEASWVPFLQPEIGLHEYTNENVTSAFLALRAGVAWPIGASGSVGIGVKVQTLPGVDTPGFGGVVRRLPGKTFVGPQILLGARLW